MMELMQEFPRPNIFREGVKEVVGDRNWPTEVKKIISKLQPGEGDKGIRSVGDVFSELAIRFNNLGVDGLGSYTALREIIDTTCGASVYTDENVSDDDRLLALIPLIWLDRLIGVNSFLNEADGVMKGGIVKYLQTSDNQLYSYLTNTLSKEKLDLELENWLTENDKYLIVSDGFFQVDTKKSETTM